MSQLIMILLGAASQTLALLKTAKGLAHVDDTTRVD